MVFLITQTAWNGKAIEIELPFKPAMGEYIMVKKTVHLIKAIVHDPERNQTYILTETYQELPFFVNEKGELK